MIPLACLRPVVSSSLRDVYAAVFLLVFSSAVMAQGLPVRWSQPHATPNAIGIQAAVAIDDMNGDGVDDIALTPRYTLLSELRGFEVRSGRGDASRALFGWRRAADLVDQFRNPTRDDSVAGGRSARGGRSHDRPDRNGDGQDEVLAVATGQGPSAGGTHTKFHVFDPVTGIILHSYVAPESIGFLAQSYGAGEPISMGTGCRRSPSR